MGWQQIEGWFDYQDLYEEFARGRQEGVFVEVGVVMGQSLAFMLEKTRGSAVEVWGVDPWDEELREGSQVRGPFESFCAVMGANAPGDFERARIVRARTTMASELFEDCSVDMVFIDGAHDYVSVVGDISCWQPKVKGGGLLAGHDHTHHRPDVEKAVTKIFGTKYEVRGSCWLVRIP